MSKRSAARQEAITRLLFEEGTVKVASLSKAFEVSEETIRQDLSRLESLGVCSRTHGGASLLSNTQVSTDIKATEHAKEKSLIAKEAVTHITNGTTVWIGPGSTLTSMARYLPLRKDLTIITNNLDFALAAKNSRHDIILIGGRMQKKGGCTAGGFALDNLTHIRIDTAFIGCDGFTSHGEPTTFSFEEMAIKQFVITHAEKKILLCDGSKFTHTGSYSFASPEAFDQCITSEVPTETQPLLSLIRDVIIVR